MQYYQVFISAEQTVQAHRILDALIARQLVFGGPVVGGPAKFRLNFRDNGVAPEMREHRLFTLEQDYNYIISYTRDDLVEIAESASLEEVCMISFLPIEPNRSLRLLLEASLDSRGDAVQPEPVDAVAALTLVPTEQIPARTKSWTGAVGIRR